MNAWFTVYPGWLHKCEWYYRVLFVCLFVQYMSSLITHAATGPNQGLGNVTSLRGGTISRDLLEEQGSRLWSCATEWTTQGGDHELLAGDAPSTLCLLSFQSPHSEFPPLLFITAVIVDVSLLEAASRGENSSALSPNPTPRLVRLRESLAWWICVVSWEKWAKLNKRQSGGWVVVQLHPIPRPFSTKLPRQTSLAS